MLVAESLGRLRRLTVQNEVDVALTEQADILAAMARHFAEAQRQKQRFELGDAIFGGGGVFDEFKAVGGQGFCSMVSIFICFSCCR